MKYLRSGMSIREKAELEAALAESSILNDRSEKLSASLDYIAMMTEVELPEEDELGE